MALKTGACSRYMMLMSNVLLTLRRDNAPVALSSGVPLTGAHATSKLVTLTAVSSEYGIVELPLNDPSMSRHNLLWQRAWAAPYAKGDDKRFGKLASKPALPFAAVSDPHLFWMEAKNYTHVLMDSLTRQMVGVRVLKAGPVWRTLAEGMEEPARFMREAGPFDQRDMARTLDLAQALRGKRVYACLHPAPIDPATGTAVWCFDGIDQVALLKDEDSWETAFIEAVEKEDCEIGVFA